MTTWKEKTMKFGLFVNSQQPRGDDPVLRFRQCVQQVIVARDTGFDAIAAGHHYVSPPYIAIQNLPFLARLAADSGQMDLVLAVTLLALLEPGADRRGDRLARCDVGGRVVFGVGIGYREEEFQAFGLQVSDRVPRMLEGLKLIKRLWTEDDVTHQGRYFNLREATSTIRPVQKPHPPIWIAANADKAVERTGRLGYPWFINPHAALPTTERQWGLYKAALAGAGHPVPAQRPMVLELCVAPTREEAVALAGPISKANTRPMPPGARTRCCRARRASASRSTNWRRTASSSAAPTT
jgi:alkanesulfonate monooxygenase SsuD/methylene tetrahydromethanopterin reductase-like flavin-dependent oxidoreductase (luciferase family)